MIEIQNLSKEFGPKTAVKDLTLTLQDGEVFGLLGPNGAGKSTTIKMITGILNTTRGDVVIDGKSILKDALEAKRNMAFVADSPDMFLGMTGIQYLTFIASVYKVDGMTFRRKVEELAEEFNMKDALTDLIINYSHGMRQKIFIIGSLIHDPKNWILDEPLTGLDPDAAFKVKNHMRRMADEGKCVLFSTHVLDVAEKVCDKIGIIAHGELLFAGTLEELRGKENLQGGDLEDLFLNMTK
jgi:ABC-2 type transport system ATP-binding protein